jgi:hypothetical protein
MSSNPNEALPQIHRAVTGSARAMRCDVIASLALMKDFEPFHIEVFCEDADAREVATGSCYASCEPFYGPKSEPRCHRRVVGRN